MNTIEPYSYKPVATDRNLIGSLLRVQQAHPDFNPRTLIDIGANKGVFGATIREAFPQTKILMVEASMHHDKQLNGVAAAIGNAEYRIAVLTGRAGDDVMFYEAGGDTGNSVFRQRGVTEKPFVRKSSTLDQIVQESFLKDQVIDIVKADVQGAELVVLRGASHVLANATWVFVENSVSLYNEGGACYYDVDGFLRSQGFFLYDMDGINRAGFNPIGLEQFDALYMKPTSEFLHTPMKSSHPLFCGQGNSSTSEILSPCPACPTHDYRDLSNLLFPVFALGYILGCFLPSLFKRHIKSHRQQNGNGMLPHNHSSMK